MDTIHDERRDQLMHAAWYLKTWVDDTKAQRIPPRKYATPGVVQTMRDCIRLARAANHLAIQARREMMQP